MIEKERKKEKLFFSNATSFLIENNLEKDYQQRAALLNGYNQVKAVTTFKAGMD